MGTELGILALYGIVVALIIGVQALAAVGQVGLTTLAGPRDDMPELRAVAGRLKRALDNSVVAMALFAPAILILNTKGISTSGTLLAAQVFLIARVVYVVIYAAGLAWLRTAVWAAGFAATLFLYVVGL